MIILGTSAVMLDAIVEILIQIKFMNGTVRYRYIKTNRIVRNLINVFDENAVEYRT